MLICYVHDRIQPRFLGLLIVQYKLPFDSSSEYGIYSVSEYNTSILSEKKLSCFCSHLAANLLGLVFLFR